MYDNAQLARVYLHAWQVTGDELFRTIAEETLDYVAREMRRPEGGFYSTQDADSEGEEGKFFVWTADEIRDVLGAEGDEFIEAYGVKRGGNWEAAFSLEDRAPERGDRYRRIAEENADFLLHYLQTDTGRLFHSWKAAKGQVSGEWEGVPKIDGFLEDYANLAEGLLALYQATFDARWYQAAHHIVDSAMARFWVTGEGFYDTATDAEELITRPRDMQDNATPSGNAMITTVLMKLSDLSMTHRYAKVARENLGVVEDFMGRAPLGFGQWLVALDYTLSRPFEIAIVGPPDDEATQRLLRAAMSGFRPHQVIACGAPNQEAPAVPLLGDRGLVDGKPAAYVCRDFACQAPVTDVEELRQQLERGAF